MRSKKTIVLAACALAAACAFAGHGAVPPYPNFGLPRTEEMMFLVLQIGVIIFAAKLGGMLASLVRLPSILGELAAGIVIGPWALGGIGEIPPFFTTPGDANVRVKFVDLENPNESILEIFDL